MSVLLIEPPPLQEYGNLRSKGSFGNLKTDIRWTPIDLIVIAGFLRKHYLEVSIIDACGERINKEQLQKRFHNHNIKLIILNTSTTTIYQDIKIAEMAKTFYKDALVGLIGVHVMALPEETLHLSKSIDFVVYSEPEPPIMKLAKTLDMTKTLGIAYRSADGIVKNPASSPVENLDDLGIPAHDLVPFDLYREPQMKRSPMSVTMISRGCVNRCSFCSSNFFNHYRVRSIDNVLKELEWISKVLRIKELKFIDDGINYKRHWLKELLGNMIERNIDITWNANVRADYLDYELAVLMKRAGCHTLNIGIESGDETILDNVNKNLKIDLIKSKVQQIKEAGLEWQAYFMLGLPGETKESMRKTLELALQLDPDLVTFNIATPHPGTAFFNLLKENRFLKDVDWNSYDTNSQPVYNYPHLSSKEIYAFSLKANRRFYYRPKYIVRRIKRIRSLKELDNVLKNFYAFSKNFIIKSNFRLAFSSLKDKLRSLWCNSKIFNNFWTYRLGKFVFSFNYWIAQQRLLKSILKSLGEDSVILEIGSGTCENIKLYGSRRSVLSDINYDYLSSAKRYYSAYKSVFFCQDGCHLSFKDKAFDLVVITGLFHHISDNDSRRIVTEAKRVLKKSSQLLIIDAIVPTSFGIFNIFGKILCALDRGRFFRNFNQHQSLFKSDGLKIIEDYKKKVFPYEIAVFRCQRND